MCKNCEHFFLNRVRKLRAFFFKSCSFFFKSRAFFSENRVRFFLKMAWENHVRKSRAKIACENRVRKSRAKIACKNCVRKSRAKIACENRVRKLSAKIACKNCVQKLRAKIACENRVPYLLVIFVIKFLRTSNSVKYWQIFKIFGPKMIGILLATTLNSYAMFKNRF